MQGTACEKEIGGHVPPEPAAWLHSADHLHAVVGKPPMQTVTAPAPRRMPPSTHAMPHMPCSQPHLATMTSAPSDLTHRSISSTHLQAGRAHRTMSHAYEEHVSSNDTRAACPE